MPDMTDDVLALPPEMQAEGMPDLAEQAYDRAVHYERYGSDVLAGFVLFLLMQLAERCRSLAEMRKALADWVAATQAWQEHQQNPSDEFCECSEGHSYRDGGNGGSCPVGALLEDAVSRARYDAERLLQGEERGGRKMSKSTVAAAIQEVIVAVKERDAAQADLKRWKKFCHNHDVARREALARVRELEGERDEAIRRLGEEARKRGLLEAEVERLRQRLREEGHYDPLADGGRSARGQDNLSAD